MPSVVSGPQLLDFESTPKSQLHTKWRTPPANSSASWTSQCLYLQFLLSPLKPSPQGLLPCHYFVLYHLLKVQVLIYHTPQVLVAAHHWNLLTYNTIVPSDMVHLILIIELNWIRGKLADIVDRLSESKKLTANSSRPLIVAAIKQTLHPSVP